MEYGTIISRVTLVGLEVVLQMRMNKKHPAPVPMREHFKEEEKELNKSVL